MKKYIIGFLPLFIMLAIVFVMREKSDFDEINFDSDQVDTVIIVTPNSEMIQYEFAEAFKEYYFKKYGRKVDVDYRNLGGTSDIVRFIYDKYLTNFKRYYTDELKLKWNDDVEKNFANQYLTDDDSEIYRARELFLESNVTCDLDLFWGGGSFDHSRQAKQGFAVDAKVAERHPEYFKDSVIPSEYSGEIFYDSNGRYYGTCLSSFGICYNVDRVRDNGQVSLDDWEDLGSKELLNELILADPSKSGSVNKCFELIIQSSMRKAQKLHGKERGAEIGWSDGLNLIKRMIGNARYIGDSAGKVTREVAKGDGTCGIAIDFYALTENEYSAKMHDDGAKIFYKTPASGAPISIDAIQLLRGAPNRKVAEEFIDFVLSKEGQKLWNYRVGTPGGPKKYALRRPAIRRDLYEEKYQQYFSDPDYNPYHSAKNVIYNGGLTGRYFNLIRILIKTTMLDVQDELKLAWNEIIRQGGPEKVPEAMSYFNRDIISYKDAREASSKLYPNEDNSMLDILIMRRKWSYQAIENFEKAYELAKEGR